MKVELNPGGAEREYLAALNASFGAWGDEARFAWAFRRTAGGPPADLMLLRDGGALLAGSAVSYRQARWGAATPTLVGIMTGSWTLPAARGKGCFTRIIDESRACCRARGAALLLAFVTEDNASFRRLRDAGSRLYETAYWNLAPGAGPASAAEPRAPAVPADAPALHAAHEGRPDEGLRFTYDAEGYRGQFLARPTPVEAWRFPEGTALVERAGATDRVLALYPEHGRGAGLVAAVARCSHAAGRTLFTFTGSDAPQASWLRAAGGVPKRGYFTVLAAGEDRTVVEALPASLSLENGDRM